MRFAGIDHAKYSLRERSDRAETERSRVSGECVGDTQPC